MPTGPSKTFPPKYPSYSLEKKFTLAPQAHIATQSSNMG